VQDNLSNKQINTGLTDQKYWDEFWKFTNLPVIAKPENQITTLLKNYLPFDTEMELFEVGCAPGGWLAYFNREFGYKVSGIEYAEQAYQLTRKNLSILNVDSQLFFGDVFDFQSNKEIDILFSRGFIEHFENTEEVVKKLASISSKYIVTVIPNLFGINGLISKIFRPKVYEKHIVISLDKLRALHEKNNLEVIFCNYSNEFRIFLPLDKNDFSRKNPTISKVLNYPIKLINLFTRKLFKMINWFPKTKMFSPSLICICKKESNH